MTLPLILRHDNWADLIADLAGRREDYRWLRGIGLSLAAAVLAAPAAVSYWIASRSPLLARSADLNILVVGAEATDAPDQGKWYQFVPELLDSNCRVNAYLVGAELDDEFRSGAARYAPLRAARCHRVSLDKFLSEKPFDCDVTFVFQPGLQKHRAWLAPSGFARLTRSGAPLVGTSYEVDEYEMECWVLECYGYRVSSQPLLNPYTLDIGDEKTSIRWGRAMWQVEESPAPGVAVAWARLAALDTLTRMTMHSISQVRIPAPGYGATVELGGSDGSSRSLIHIADRRFVDSSSGELLYLDGNQLQSKGRIPLSVVQGYPGSMQREIERAVWAAEIKSRYLMDGYSASPDPHQEKQMSRDMFAAMRSKALSLFR